MTIIPTTPQPWNNNPDGYVKHQLLLVQLVDWLRSQGADVQVPEDTGKPDRGVDLIINGLCVDLKGCRLDAYGSSYTWNSPYYRGRSGPLYGDSLTDYFVHPTDGPPSEWIAAPAECLRKSKYDLPPYYFQHECFDMAEFIRE